MRIYLLLACLFMSAISFGQHSSSTFEIQAGGTFTLEKNEVPVRTLATDASGIYMVYLRQGIYGDGKRFLYKFDHQLKLIARQSQPLDFDLSGKRVTYHFLQAADRLFYISYPREFRGTNSFNLQEINQQTLEFSPPRLIKISPQTGGQQIDRTSLSVSPNKERIALIHTLSTPAKGSQAFAVNVFDKDMEPLWDDVFQVPYQSAGLQLSDLQVDSEGTVHLLNRHYFKGQRPKRKKAVNYENLLFSFYADGKMLTHTLDGGGGFLHGLHLAVNTEGHVICAGPYSKARYLGLGGIYFFKLNGKSGDVLRSSFLPLESDLLLKDAEGEERARLEKSLAEDKAVEYAVFEATFWDTQPDGSMVFSGFLGDADDDDTAYRIPNDVTTAERSYDFVRLNVDSEGRLSAQVLGVQRDDIAQMSRAGELILFELYNINEDAVEASDPQAFRYVTEVDEYTTLAAWRMPYETTKTELKRFSWGKLGTEANLIYSRQLSETDMLIVEEIKPKVQRLIRLRFNE